jgi:L-histidine Nalpha-methyltransferase
VEQTLTLTSFAQDVEKGLSSPVKYLSSSYFYDEMGSTIFQQIMDLPEYYLSRCEAEILSTHCNGFLKAFQTKAGFDLIELGVGDGSKTAILLDHFLKQSVDFTYAAIDISASALEGLETALSKQFPTLQTKMIANDYFLGLETLQLQSKRRKIVLFMGSTIGNFTNSAAIRFLKQLRQYMNPNDLLCLGYDLKKDPNTILAAYNDNQLVTAEFNYNLLRRMNQELGANFSVENFIHAPIYHPQKGCAESYLLSIKKQSVYIKALDKTFSFDEWEAIHTEVSYKYSVQEMEKLTFAAGFSPKTNFFDAKKYFCNAIFKV